MEVPDRNVEEDAKVCEKVPVGLVFFLVFFFVGALAFVFNFALLGLLPLRPMASRNQHHMYQV